jgi:Xaa-Pro aminopeptidase
MEPYESRRRALLERLDRGVAVLRAAPVTVRNNDVEHAYRQDSDLLYLTGLDEPDCALVLSNVHSEHRSVLFVRPRNPDREMWEGPRVGVDEAPKRYGVNVAYSIDELADKLPGYLLNVQKLMTRMGSNAAYDAAIFKAIGAARSRARNGGSWPTEIIDPTLIIDEMRLVKSDCELQMVRRAIQITAEGHLRAMRETRPGMKEYEIEALLSHTYRSGGAERHAYEPIVGSGPNGTVLHYVRNNRVIEPNDLVLIDSGAEYGYYAADVTRTFPASGKFTAEQRQIYQIVLDAQLAALGDVRPGVSVEDLHRKACEVIVDGLLGLGLLGGDRAEILDTQSYKRFFPHRTSHWLGMDVHDVGRYFVDSKPRGLSAGMLLTVEPGIYVPPGDSAPKQYQGIGVRIEDDVLVTDSGCEVLTAAVPKTIAELEAVCGR